jgi:hypothetical protein
MNAPEIWKDVVGYEGRYSVSSFGRVYSHVTARFLRPGRLSGGHMSVALGRKNSRLVHHLVLEAFVGPRKSGQEGRHKNGRPNQNQLTNLAWSSRSRNGQDKKWHAGAKTYILSGEDAKAVKRMLAAEVKGVIIANTFGISQSTVSAIKHGKFHVDA